MKKAAFIALAAAIVLGGCSDPSDPPNGGDGSVSGTIEGNVAWTSDTYVSGYTSLASGASLTIGPGVAVSFASGAALAVFPDSSLMAEGTAAHPIVFEAAVGAAGWGGIRFEDDADDADNGLAYCDISGVVDDYAVSIDDGAFAEIDHCVIGDNAAGGVYAELAEVGSEVMDCSFGDNGDDGVEYFDLVYNAGVLIGSGNILSSSYNVSE